LGFSFAKFSKNSASKKKLLQAEKKCMPNFGENKIKFWEIIFFVTLQHNFQFTSFKEFGQFSTNDLPIDAKLYLG
jgi:hypothetical protein